MRAGMHIATYADIQQLLSAERSLTDAAEAHGTLAGSLCTATAYRFEDWLVEILPEGKAQADNARALRELFAGTQDALTGEMLDFEPLLPADAEPIGERTTALAQWCVGFLYGLGSSALPDAGGLPGELGEVVRDFTEISRVEVDMADSEESNESAYTELVEFVRVGVQLVFDELGGLREPPREPPGAPFH
jgi:uncharacterized protein YgfB (UPF0149 family)